MKKAIKGICVFLDFELSNYLFTERQYKWNSTWYRTYEER